MFQHTFKTTRLTDGNSKNCFRFWTVIKLAVSNWGPSSLYSISIGYNSEQSGPCQQEDN